MKHHLKPPCTILATALAAALHAAVPLSWEVRPTNPAPAAFDRHHGETINLTATFRGFGELPFAPEADVRLWYQTNGMGQAWWSAPATVQSNVISATWSPALDPGADRVSLFFGAPSNVYASAVLRLRHSPGFAPGAMPDPESFHEADPVFSAWLSTFSESDPVFSSWLSTFEIPETSLEPSTNYTDRALSSFAATGTVARALTYGTPTRWSDATGCVWEVTETWVSVPATFPDTAPTGFIHPIEAYAGKPIYLWEGYSPGGWWTPMCENLPLGLGKGEEDSTSLSWTAGVDAYFSFTATRGIVTNLVGRVALTNDISAAINSLSSVLRITIVESARSATNYTDQALSSFSATGKVENAEAADVASDADYASQAGEAYRLYDSEQENSYTASDFATQTELGSVSETANAAAHDAASALRIVLGESVWFAVTNYMRTAEGVIPSLQLWEVRDSVTNLVYDSREEITNTVKALTRELHTELTNRIHDVEKTIPSKAWGNYQSDGTDNPEPGKVAIVNQPTVILTGGGTFNKYLEVGNSSVWVLKSSGLCSFGGDTNGNFFAVLDDEGKTHFKVSKTDSFDVDAICNGIFPRQSQNSVLLYVVSTNRQGQVYASPPVLSASTNLQETVWHEEVDGEVDPLGLSVSWERDDAISAWVATITPDTYPPALFLKAKVKQEGGVSVINTAPVRFDGGIQLGNGKYRLVPYTTGGKTYLTVEGLQ